MKHTHDIEKKLENTLNSLDSIRRASPSPYFYTRLKARLAREENSWSGIAGFIGRPVFALAMVCIVLFVNTWILFDADTTEVAQGNNVQQVVTELPDEYNLAVNTFYNYDTP
jgi:hypothetical protein